MKVSFAREYTFPDMALQIEDCIYKKIVDNVLDFLGLRA
jgi:hypothetical protein